jgi:very-short-patch-repair endonuclease
MRSSILTSKRAKALRRNLTEPEVMLWSRLRRRLPDQPAFRNQHPVGAYILDFFCAAARLAVEIDGATHGEVAAIAHDKARDRWLGHQGIRVVRIPASSVFADVDEVANNVRLTAAGRLAELAAPSPVRSSADGPPPALRRGGK